MDEVSLNSEPVYDDEAENFEIDGDCAMTEYVGEAGVLQGENPLPPAVGMEFETYEDVYYFYNCYAQQQGFGVRVSNTWYRKSKEKYRGKLSCSSAGFKKKTEANRPRPQTRTGCPAMIKFRLMENKRWWVIEVELEHNHLLTPTSGKFYKSHRNVGLGSKRPLQVDGPEEIQKIRLFRTVIIDREYNGSANVDEGKLRNNVDQFNNQLRLKQGDAQSIHKFFTHQQLMNLNFFYVMDLNEKGCLRNVFWADARSRATYGYFGDVVVINTSCLTTKHEVPLVIFTGVNHHGHSVLLGCGLVAGGNVESYVWLFRAWLTYMVGRSPHAIITDQNKSLKIALAEVFPRASHFIYMTSILKQLPHELGGVSECEAVMEAFTRLVYDPFRAVDFEAAWEDMMDRHGIRHHKWLQTLYEDRKHWVPVYIKETFLAGMFPMKESERVTSPFEGYLSKDTSLKDFLNSYDQALKEIDQREVMADMESRNPCGMLKSTFYLELQLSKLYTSNIFMKFQEEVVGMLSCFNPRQMSMDGSVISYLVTEHAEVEDNRRETRDFEVSYNTSDGEILCLCGLFSFKGYLCRHALCVLNQNGVEEIPPQYILSRWRKDIHRNYDFEYGYDGIDSNNPLHRYDNLYKCITKVVEEGRKSHDRYKYTLQALDDILSKIRLQDDHLV
ncbi:protein FAR1-RELATED SEQUENCE 6-like [Coffea arabica]|uniref:Protein FAR1-RELATED SEQUENCE n=1 Tax=Coffea arabica TaxID=13443 RepID=A0A6P6XEY7_COFAR